MIKSLKTLLVTLLTSFGMLSLAGCSGFVLPPKGSPTMAQVYGASQTGQTYFDSNSPESSNQGGTSKSDIQTLPRISLGSGSPQRAANDSNQGILRGLNQQFPTLPNPQVLMYIFGHYAGANQMPVPGHFVSFSFYNKTYYALPNEVLKPFNDGQFIR